MIRAVSKTPVVFALMLGSVLFMMPFFVMVSMSLKSPEELARTSVLAWPVAPTLENYRFVLANPTISFQLFFRNTVVIALLTTFGTLASSAVVAYGFARMKFAGRDRLFLLLLATMMLPGIVTMIPSYVIFARLGWVNTYLPLVVPSFFAAAYNVFLLRQFFLNLPRELDEAAMLDGAGPWAIFGRIVLPLSGPALMTVGIFAFIYNWRDFMGPLLYLNEPDKLTLETGLRLYQSQNDDQWHLIMAASTLVSVPLVVLFFLGQKAFIRGIVMTGGK